MSNLQAKHATPLNELVAQRLETRKRAAAAAAQKVNRNLEAATRAWFARSLGVQLDTFAVAKISGDTGDASPFAIVLTLPVGIRTNGRIVSGHKYQWHDGDWSEIFAIKLAGAFSWRVERTGATNSKTFADFVDAAIYLQVGK